LINGLLNVYIFSLALFALFYIMSISDKLPRKGMTSDNIHILDFSKTHLDNSFDDTTVAIQGYTIEKPKPRRDRNAYG
jgi:hypothetical protein